MKRTYKGKAIYDFQGPTKGDIFRKERTPSDISWRLSRVEHELPPRLEDNGIRIWCKNQTGRSIEVFVETSERVNDLNAAFAICLDDLDLFGDAFVQCA